MQKPLPKELLSLAGEYAVASALCRRRVYAQLTLGNRKRTDILVDTDDNMMRIEVKAAQNNEWPAIRGLHRIKDALVLVDFTGKTLDDTPDFYILNLNDWKQLVAEEEERYPNITVDGENQIKYPDGWKGLNLKPARVATFKDKWEKIVGLSNG